MSDMDSHMDWEVLDVESILDYELSPAIPYPALGDVGSGDPTAQDVESPVLLPAQTMHPEPNDNVLDEVQPVHLVEIALASHIALPPLPPPSLFPALAADDDQVDPTLMQALYGFVNIQFEVEDEGEDENAEVWGEAEGAESWNV
ncbi:hypothetical protein FRC07_004270 [Ceratobasidium sp. 392]|nr:hypothetical protein FRC07_004270 [Ceratobasidium sp. 392]